MSESSNGLNFGQALEALKSGRKACRKGWNGKGMWIEHWKPMHQVDLPYLMLMYPVNSSAYPNGARVPWLPSQTDVLANDWELLP